ncbi:unnamed protein product [Phytophthora fragariaefolia]|uniref:Unnamed protein product n=1 Tax=Phytophthora fragariaefolia TaxID=1490495 RepID=A0A9W6XGA7_9STRA|nr:unnamed protein product [Phytophthora fragariaefolia]
MLAEQEAKSKPKLDETERRIHAAERRALEVERSFREASAQATVAQGVPVQEARTPSAAAYPAAEGRGTKLNALPGPNKAVLEMQEQSLLEKLKAVGTARVQEQEAASNMQKFQAEQIRNLKATSAETQPGRATTRPDLATPVKTEVNNPERATRNPVASGENVGQAPDIWTNVGQINLSEAAIAQLSATILNVNLSACVGSVKEEGVKRETNTSAAATATKSTKRQGARTDAARPKQESKYKAAPKPDPKKSERKLKPSKKKRPSKDLSHGSFDSSSEPEEDNFDSSSSSDSSGEEARSSTKTSSKAEVGSTLLTFRTYVNPNALEKFDEKAPIGDSKPWWERFLDMTEQGVCTDKGKFLELRMKMSSAVRNWRGHHPKHVQANWKTLSREFRHKYLKTRTSESERYFTMGQKPGETPLDFLYRLNEAVVKAGIKYKSQATKRA